MRRKLTGLGFAISLVVISPATFAVEPPPAVASNMPRPVMFVPVAGWTPMAGQGYPVLSPMQCPVPGYPPGMFPAPPSQQSAPAQNPQAPQAATPAPAAQQPSTDAFSQADATGTESSGAYMPNMLGDFQGYSVKRILSICQPPVQVTPANLPLVLRNLGQGGGGFLGNQVGGNVLANFNFPQVGNIPLLGGAGNVVGTAITEFQIQSRLPQQPNCQQQLVRIPIATRAGFKIAEDESPRPQRRVFFNYNYYNDVNGDLNKSQQVINFNRNLVNNPGIAPLLNRLPNNGNVVNLVGQPGINGPFNVINPTLTPPSIDVHTQVLGFELPFIDDIASFELRVPAAQQIAPGELDGAEFGDITAVLKYAIYLNPNTGDVCSLGLGLTSPTGGHVSFAGSRIDSFLIQPFLGYIYTFGPFYLHGFSSLVVPTDSVDAVLWFNDIGLGLLLERPNRIISAIAPTIELHLTTPLTKRGSLHEPLGVPDILVPTAGFHIYFWERTSLTLGGAVPISGPQPFAFEALAQLNYRF